MVSNIRFGAVFIPSNGHNDQKRDNILGERKEPHMGESAYPRQLTRVIGDLDAHWERGEAYPAINRMGWVLFSQSVSDESMRQSLESAGYRDVEAIADDDLRTMDFRA